MKYTFYILIFLGVLLTSSCNETLINPSDNQPPNTTLFLDSIRNQQNSRVFVSWSGEDTDGMVIGYVFSWDKRNWYFTRKNDSTFALQVESSDTNFRFSIAAIDNSLKQYPNEGERIEFVDKNNNGFHDSGEDFPKLHGAVDPTPANLLFPIKNSAPIIAWGNDQLLSLHYPLHCRIPPLHLQHSKYSLLIQMEMQLLSP